MKTLSNPLGALKNFEELNISIKHLLEVNNSYQHEIVTLINIHQPLRDGQMLYYNFIRPHMTLEGKTPAQKAGINVNLGQNKWMELLKQAIDTQKRV